MKGFFITFEGGEGAGKTTLIDRLEKHFRACGNDVVRTREPGGSILSETIRKWVLEYREIKIAPMAELLLFLSARAQHIAELIAPALERGAIVLCDRYNDSTISYQGIARELGLEKVSQMCELVTGRYQPDVTFYLDIAPNVGLQRSRFTHKDTAKAGTLDKIEDLDLSFHERVRQGFLKLAEMYPERILKN